MKSIEICDTFQRMLFEESCENTQDLKLVGTVRSLDASTYLLVQEEWRDMFIHMAASSEDLEEKLLYLEAASEIGLALLSSEQLEIYNA